MSLRTQLLIFLVIVLASKKGFAQDAFPLRVYEFDSISLEANNWAEIPGGFEGAQSGSTELVTFPDETFSSSNGNQGLAITVAPGEVTMLYAAEPVVSSDVPVLLRMTVRASSPWASVALIALRGDLSNDVFVDGSLGLNNPAKSVDFVEEERRLILVYEPLGTDMFTPTMQVAGIGESQNESATIWIDKFEVLSINSQEFGANPPQFEETITIPLDLPNGAIPLEMVLIPAGEFMLGSPEDEQGRFDDGRPHCHGLAPVRFQP